MAAVSSRFPATTMTPAAKTCAPLWPPPTTLASTGGLTSDAVANRSSSRETPLHRQQRYPISPTCSRQRDLPLP